jgi:TolB-like protein/tetratricopeptide (TPR) repeat protein
MKSENSPQLKPITSLAVLPFINGNGDSNVEFLSDGISESLINSLSLLSQLKVVARTTAFHYKDKQIDPQQVGRDLKVDAIVLGKVTQLGDVLIVQADLISTEDGSQIWGERYTRKQSDILTVQEDVTRRLLERLRLKLTGEDKEHIAKQHTSNAQAYQLYLKGQYHVNKRTDEDWQKATDYFQQAIRLDPNYALAYTGLAGSFTANRSLPAHERMPKAKDAVMKALSIDNKLAEAHTALALIKDRYDWDWAGAEAEYKRAIELSPNDFAGHHKYGSFLSRLGRHDEAIEELRFALQLDPISVNVNADLGLAYLFADEVGLAIEQLQKAKEIDSSFSATYFYLAQSYEKGGEFDKAIEEYLTLASFFSAKVKDELKTAYLANGWKGFWQKRLDMALKRIREDIFSPTDIAGYFCRLGKSNEALKWLERAYQERDTKLTNLMVDSVFDSLRRDSRFQDLLRRVGFSK